MSCVPNVPPKDIRVIGKLDERAKIEEFCESYPKLVGPIAGDLRAQRSLRPATRRWQPASPTRPSRASRAARARQVWDLLTRGLLRGSARRR